MSGLFFGRCLFRVVRVYCLGLCMVALK